MLYVTFAIYVQGAKRTSCNNEFKYFVSFETIVLKRNECFGVSNSSGIPPPAPPPHFTSSRLFLGPAEDFFWGGPSKEEEDLGAKWGRERTVLSVALARWGGPQVCAEEEEE